MGEDIPGLDHGISRRRLRSVRSSGKGAWRVFRISRSNTVAFDRWRPDEPEFSWLDCRGTVVATRFHADRPGRAKQAQTVPVQRRWSVEQFPDPLLRPPVAVQSDLRDIARRL